VDAIINILGFLFIGGFLVILIRHLGVGYMFIPTTSKKWRVNLDAVDKVLATVSILAFVGAIVILTCFPPNVSHP